MVTTQRGCVLAGLVHFVLCASTGVRSTPLLGPGLCLQVLVAVSVFSCNNSVSGRTCLLKSSQFLASNALIELYAIPAACMFSSSSVRILCIKCRNESYSSRYNNMCDTCGDRNKDLWNKSYCYEDNYCSKCKQRYSPDKYYNVCNRCGDQDKKEEEERKKREELRRKEEELRQREKEIQERERDLRRQEEEMWKREAEKKKKPWYLACSVKRL